MNKHTPIFHLQHVGYTYYGHTALKGISFTIREGEQVCVLGVNGSGKSTLLKILAALYFPTHGACQAFGNSVNEDYFQNSGNAKAFRKKVGFVFQDSDVQLFSPTVWDELAFAPLQLGCVNDEINRRCTEALRMMSISHLKTRSPHALSGGEKKRVAIASVLTQEPDVWLFDEPTESLDPRSTGMVIDIIRSFAERGKTVISVTHDLEIVEEVSTRAIVLNENHTVAWDGPSHTLLSSGSLLTRLNLVHTHRHKHAKREHRHVHLHTIGHRHAHQN
jgi:cobalt/nickel transport system ATP-binding protein